MHKKQDLQETKLCDCKITRHHSLHSFLPTNTYPNVGSLDHANIIGTITNAQGNLLGIFFDQSSNLQT
jgi:hypothetical protein